MTNRDFFEKAGIMISSCKENGIHANWILNVYFWLIILLGTVLRVYDLGAESYWGDEVVTLRVARQSIPQIIASFKLDEPLAYNLPFHFWIKAFGPAEATTRIFSALLGIAAIFLIYRVGRELFSRKVALLSALLMAISEYQILYSQEIRSYTLFECSTLLSFLLFMQALSRKRGRYFVLWGLSCLLLLASHSYGAFILVAQDLFFLLRLKKYQDVFVQWFLCQLPIFLAVLLYFFPMVLDWWEPIFRSAVINRQRIPNPSLSAPVHSLYWFTLPIRHARSWGSVLIVYVIAGLVLVTGTLFYQIRRGKNHWLASVRGLAKTIKQEPNLPEKLLLLDCWLLCPIVLPFFLSQVIPRMYEDRYTISAASAFYLLLAFGLFHFRKVVPLLIFLGALGIVIAPGVYYYYEKDVKEQWREVADYLEKNYRVSDVIVFAHDQESYRRNSFNWYYRGGLPTCSVDRPIIEDQTISIDLINCTAEYRRFWLIVNGPESVTEQFIKYPFDQNRQGPRLIIRQQFTGIVVSLFELNSGGNLDTP